jgi:hypothetical protein
MLFLSNLKNRYKITSAIAVVMFMMKSFWYIDLKNNAKIDIVDQAIICP